MTGGGAACAHCTYWLIIGVTSHVDVCNIDDETGCVEETTFENTLTSFHRSARWTVQLDKHALALHIALSQSRAQTAPA